MPLSSYYKALTGDWSLRPGVAAPTRPTAIYLGLFTSGPAADGTGGAEVVGGGYARQLVTFGAWVAGLTDNTNVIQFPTSTVAWGTVTHIKLLDALTVGNPLLWKQLTVSKVVGAGLAPSFDVGELDLDLNRLNP